MTVNQPQEDTLSEEPKPQWWEKCWRCGKRRFSKDSMCVHCGAQP